MEKKFASVLFIGNSYTYYNRMYDTFVALCDAAGIQVEMDQITAGGYRILDFCNPDRKEHEHLLEALKKKTWDFCILQEQSFRPAIERKAYFDSLEKISPLLKEHTKKQFLYQTWGYGEGNPLLAEYGYTSESMAVALRDSVRAAAKIFGYGVCPVGDAFLTCRSEHPEIELYDHDQSHPSPAGSYLAACVHAVSLFGTRIGAAEYTGELDKLNSLILRRLADREGL